MGRELKRVTMDFDWPLNKAWSGYINPFASQCTDCLECDGSGSSPEARHLSDQWYGYAPFLPADRGSKPWTLGDAVVRAIAERKCRQAPAYYGSNEGAIYREANRLCALWNAAWGHHLNTDDVKALLDAGRLMDFTHTPRTAEQRVICRKKVADGGNSWLPESNGYVPTPKEVNAWSLRGMGHDSCNAWVCVKAECERLGYPIECACCKGEGSLWPSSEIKQRADDWTRTEPPTGEGYQLWETVGEGSAISPVFATPEELAEWLATSHDYKWRENDQVITREQWLKFIIGPGWCPSMAVVDGRLISGVEAVSA